MGHEPGSRRPGAPAAHGPDPAGWSSCARPSAAASSIAVHDLQAGWTTGLEQPGRPAAAERLQAVGGDRPAGRRRPGRDRPRREDPRSPRPTSASSTSRSARSWRAAPCETTLGDLLARCRSPCRTNAANDILMRRARAAARRRCSGPSPPSGWGHPRRARGAGAAGQDRGLGCKPRNIRSAAPSGPTASLIDPAVRHPPPSTPISPTLTMGPCRCPGGGPGPVEEGRALVARLDCALAAGDGPDLHRAAAAAGGSSPAGPSAAMTATGQDLFEQSTGLQRHRPDHRPDEPDLCGGGDDQLTTTRPVPERTTLMATTVAGRSVAAHDETDPTDGGPAGEDHR